MITHKCFTPYARLLRNSLCFVGIWMNLSVSIYAEEVGENHVFHCTENLSLVYHDTVSGIDSSDCDSPAASSHVYQSRVPHWLNDSWALSTTSILSNCKDVNSADAQTLQLVRGISAVKAQAIIDYRNEFGPFKSLDELSQVRGIGPATVENFRNANFCVNDSESDSPTAAQPQNPPAPVSSQSSDCINVNTADASSLQKVNRIGAVKAQAIIEHRTENGPFQSLNDLTNVKGIGSATIENFRAAGFCAEESEGSPEPTEHQNDSPSTASESPDSNCTNVNTANASSLQSVSRIGAVKAQSIINYRSEFGPFQSLNDLARVKGIGPATVENFRKAGFCAHSSNGSVHHSDPDSTASMTDSTHDLCKDLNVVDAQTLQEVSGIGQVLSQSIIDERERSGQFGSVNELERMDAVEPSTVKTLLDAGFCVTALAPPSDSTNPLTKLSTTPSPYPVDYERSLYGGWLDMDDDCQNTRIEVLLDKSLITPTLDETGCRVLSGKWFDPYTGKTITDPQEIDIDHFIPLAEAHRSGAAAWSDQRRHLFGNDLTPYGVLIPVLASANRSQGSRGPDQWLPPNESFHCQYADRWMHLKESWYLTMDYQESKAIGELLKKCNHHSISP